jgi:hypothetical protein
VKQFLAEQTVVDMSRLTLRGQMSRVEKGRWPGGRPPYGYDLLYFNSAGEPFELVRFLDSGAREMRGIDGSVRCIIPRGETLPVTSQGRSSLAPGEPGKVAVLRQIFDWYVNGNAGFGGIADRLNRDGVVSAMGCRPGTRWKGTWSAGTVREILRNPAYRGSTAWNRISYAKFHRVEGGHAVPRPRTALGKVKRNAPADWIIVPNTHEPLVSPDVFDRAQRLITSRGAFVREALRGSPQNTPYLLSGLIRCGRCGSRWQGYRVNKGRKQPGKERPVTLYYCCGGYITKGNGVCKRALISRDEFETLVLQEVAAYVSAFLQTGGNVLLQELLADALKQAEPQSDEKTLRERLRATEAKINELVQCLTPALASTLEPKIVELRQQGEETRAALEAARATRATVTSAEGLVADLMRDLGQLGPTLTAGTFHDKRDVVRALTETILVNPETGEAELALFAIPRHVGQKRTDEPSNEKRTERPFEHLSSSYTMAGARLGARKSTFRARIIRRPWVFPLAPPRRVARSSPPCTRKENMNA